MKRREFLNIGLLTLGGVLVGRNFAFADALTETQEVFRKADPVSSYDMIINGAGLCGFFIALEAVKKGLKVLIVDKRTSPGFDIADFRMYEEEIVDKPYMLHVDYLIFGYDMDENGIVTIKDLWLKKVWEITRRMKDWSINLQVKQNVVHKIRPGVWYSTQRGNYPMFRRMEDFISAIEEAVYQNPKTHDVAGSWKRQFLASYERHFGVRLNIPRWSDIEESYDKQ